jgi:hypothetical protein
VRSALIMPTRIEVREGSAKVRLRASLQSGAVSRSMR